MIPHIVTQKGMAVVIDGVTFNVAREAPNFNAIVDAVYGGTPGWLIQGMIEATRKKVEQTLKLSSSLVYNAGCVYHHGVKLKGYAVSKLIALIEKGESVEALANFLTKIQANPDQNVIDNLYEFLEFGKIPITPNGNFLAYKAVRSDYRDIHSGSVSNEIGRVISMPRRDVDPNRDQTCSYGYHVCSFEYLKHFARADGHIVVCEVNPADVVAIPSDYNNTKMRVSAYRVVDEVTQNYEDNVNVLSTQEVWRTEYTVFARDTDSDWVEIESYEDFEEAVEWAKDELIDSHFDEVKVMTIHGKMVFFQAAG